MKTLILARHAVAASNVRSVVSSAPPGGGLTELGVEQARGLGLALRGDAIDLGVSSRLRRTEETLRVALADRGLPTVTEPLFDEIGFGSFEGGPLDDYRAWAWAHGPRVPCPGGGESRVQAATRVLGGIEWLLGRPEDTILVVGHALAARYLLDAAVGTAPRARVVPVEHATPARLGVDALGLAGETMRAWLREPRFVDISQPGSPPTEGVDTLF